MTQVLVDGCSSKSSSHLPETHISVSNIRHWDRHLHRSVWKQIVVLEHTALSDVNTRPYHGPPPAAAPSAMQLLTAWKDEVMLKSCLTFTWQTSLSPFCSRLYSQSGLHLFGLFFKPYFLRLLSFPPCGTGSHVSTDVLWCLCLNLVWICLKWSTMV